MAPNWTGQSMFSSISKPRAYLAHVYRRPLVAAEAFTSGPQDRWRLHPAAGKTYGDWAFTEGVNRFVIHASVHQPFPQIRLGISLSIHGVHCGRTQTWWELSRPWHRYLGQVPASITAGPVHPLPQPRRRTKRISAAAARARWLQIRCLHARGAAETRHREGREDRVSRKWRLPAAGVAAVL